MRPLRPYKSIRVQKLRIPTPHGGIPALLLSPVDAPSNATGVLWLHGGGYAAGSGQELPSYDGFNLAKKGDAVVVTLNHRLTVLGFLDLSAYGDKYAKSGNAGLLALVAALLWVNKNIAAIGGAAQNVTIFGQSGGGGNVST